MFLAFESHKKGFDTPITFLLPTNFMQMPSYTFLIFHTLTPSPSHRWGWGRGGQKAPVDDPIA